jgi:hypothetical protein
MAQLRGLGYALVQAIQEAPAVVGSAITALGAVLAVIAGRTWEKRQELEQGRRERIAPSYSELVAVFYKAMKGQEIDEEFFHDWTRQLLLWGPEPLIRTFIAWRASLPDEADDVSPESIFAFEEVLYAIRDDLGNPRGNMGQGDLLRVFVNDLDDYMAHRAESS